MAKLTLGQAVILCLFDNLKPTPLDDLLLQIQALRWGGRPVTRKQLEQELREIQSWGEEITWTIEDGVFDCAGLSAELSMYLPAFVLVETEPGSSAKHPSPIVGGSQQHQHRKQGHPQTPTD